MKTLAALFTFCYLLFSGFPGGASGEELSTNAGDIRDKGSKKKKKDKDSIPGSGRFPWRRAWPPTPILLPENHMDRGAWRATFHSVA